MASGNVCTDGQLVIFVWTLPCGLQKRGDSSHGADFLLCQAIRVREFVLRMTGRPMEQGSVSEVASRADGTSVPVVYIHLDTAMGIAPSASPLP